MPDRGLCISCPKLSVRDGLNVPIVFVEPFLPYDFLEDNHFSELKNAEIMGDRLRLLGEVDSFVGKFSSITFKQLSAWDSFPLK